MAWPLAFNHVTLARSPIMVDGSAHGKLLRRINPSV
jgi:hypothetical protein